MRDCIRLYVKYIVDKNVVIDQCVGGMSSGKSGVSGATKNIGMGPLKVSLTLFYQKAYFLTIVFLNKFINFHSGEIQGSKSVINLRIDKICIFLGKKVGF